LSRVEGGLQPSAEQKLLRLDELFPGCGANITNLSRFTSWERWGYDWHMDVEPTLMGMAQQNGPGWMPGSLVYFDNPIRDAHRARLEGRSRPGKRVEEPMTDEEFDKLIADSLAEQRAAQAKSMAER
jgi:hypothetical protein